MSIPLTLPAPDRKRKEKRECVCCATEITEEHGSRRMCGNCQVISMDRNSKLGNLMRAAISYGVVRPIRGTGMKCDDCGLTASTYHHADWSRPFDIIPVCRSCNGARGQAINLRKECEPIA